MTNNIFFIYLDLQIHYLAATELYFYLYIETYILNAFFIFFQNIYNYIYNIQ